MQPETLIPSTNGGPAAVVQLEPELVEALEAKVVDAQIEPAIDRPAGPAAAALLATGFACLVLGVLTALVAASPGAETFMTLSKRVGDLSGVSTITIAAYFASWGALTLLWRRSSPSLRSVAIVSGLFFAVSVVATFAPVIHLIEHTR